MKRLFCSLLLCSILLHPSFAYATFGTFSIADEEKLGNQFSIFVKSSLPILYEPEVQSYINTLLNSITKQIPPSPYTFTIYVINDPAVNAFATPGGYIFVHTGLLLAMEKESELVGVIAHEVAHITNRHIAKRIERMQKITLASLLTGLAGLALGPAGIGVLLGSLGAGQNSMLYFSRIDESEADKAGIQYLVQAGYNPYSLSKSFEIIRKTMLHKGIGSPSIYLSTHPDVRERIQSTYTQATTFPLAIQQREEPLSSFHTIQALLRSRYDIPERALSIARQKNTCVSLLEQAIIYKRKKEYRKSKEYFSKAIQCDPTNPILYREAGIMAFESSDGDSALTFLLQANVMDNQDYFTMFYLARLYSEKKQHKESLSLFKQVLQYLPEDSEVLYYYGRELGYSGKTVLGNIYLAYSAIYANRLQRAKHFIQQAEKEYTEQEQIELDKVKELYKKRETFFKENDIPLR